MSNKINDIVGSGSEDFDDFVDDFLEHYGVLGMKWGVRKDRSSSRIGTTSLMDNSKNAVVIDKSGTPITKREAKRTAKRTTHLKKFLQNRNNIRYLNEEIGEVNQMFEGVDLINDPKLRKDYQKVMSESLTVAAQQLLPKYELQTYGSHTTKPPSAFEPRFDAAIVVDADNGLHLFVGSPSAIMDIKSKVLTHESGEIPDRIRIPVIVNDGRIVAIDEKFSEETQHSDNIAGDFLEHYGVKGMRWGKVKDKETSTNYDLSSMTEEERQTMRAEMAKMAAGGASGDEITAYLEKTLNDAKRRQPGSLTVAGKTYTADEWKQYSKNQAAKLKEERANHWTQRVNDFAKSLGLKGDIFTTTTTSTNTEKVVERIRHSDNIAGDFLEHYGVLGMKWGIRKDSLGRRRPTEQVLKEQGKGRKPKNATFYHTDKATGNKVMVDYNPRKVQINRLNQGFEVTGRSKKQVRRVAEAIRSQLERGTKGQTNVNAKLNMTDDELRSAISRLQNERLYNQLTATPPRESSAAAKFMINTGSQILSQAVTNVGAEYLKQALKVNINKSVAPEYRIKKVDLKEKD